MQVASFGPQSPMTSFSFFSVYPWGFPNCTMSSISLPRPICWNRDFITTPTAAAWFTSEDCGWTPWSCFLIQHQLFNSGPCNACSGSRKSALYRKGVSLTSIIIVVNCFSIFILLVSLLYLYIASKASHLLVMQLTKGSLKPSFTWPTFFTMYFRMRWSWSTWVSPLTRMGV